jgi:hypothetical protein
MHPTEIAYFTVTMFLSLTSLIRWKRRRDLVAAAVNRGLRGYVAAGSARQLREPEQRLAENAIPV